MTIKEFSKGEAIRFGWDTMKDNIGFFAAVLIASFLITVIPSIIGELLIEEAPVLSIFFSITSWVLQLVIGMGLIKIALKFADNTRGEFIDLFSCFPLFFKYLFGSILYGLIVMFGMILLIVPGIIWAVKFQFFTYFIVDKEMGPIEALKKSSEITMGQKWHILLFDLLLFGINFLGMLAFLIGLFATVPTAMVALAFAYRRLEARSNRFQEGTSS